MCRYCEPKRPYGIEPLAEVKYLPDVYLSANIAYLSYGRYMLEIYCRNTKEDEGVRKAIECNYCPKCGRPLNYKRKR